MRMVEEVMYLRHSDGMFGNVRREEATVAGRYKL
jgi:hypothetical protein